MPRPAAYSHRVSREWISTYTQRGRTHLLARNSADKFLQCPGRLVFLLKSQGDWKFSGCGFPKLGLGMERGKEGSHVLVGDVLDFSFLLIPHNQSVSQSVPHSKQVLKSHLFTFTIIPLAKPLPLLTLLSKLPPTTSFCAAFLLAS